MSLFSTVTMDSASNFRTFWAEEVKRREKKGGEKTVLSFGQPLQPRRRGGRLSKPKNHHQLTCKAILHHHDWLFKRPSPKDGGSAVGGPSDDVIALRHLRAGGGGCVGRLIARWSSFMHVSVYLEAESPCQFPVFQTTHFGALVRLLFHELLGLQLRRLLRWSSIGRRARGFTFCVHFY